MVRRVEVRVQFQARLGCEVVLHGGMALVVQMRIQARMNIHMLRAA